MLQNGVPVVGICAWSGTGKTTLLCRLIPLLKRHGIHFAVVKHGHHECEVDHPGKDSFRYRSHGADQVVLATRNCLVNIQSREDASAQAEPGLQEALDQLHVDNLDLILVEGYKHTQFPKIELHRASLGFPLLCTNDSSVIAVASDTNLSTTTDVLGIASLDLNNVQEILLFLLHYLHRQTQKKRSVAAPDEFTTVSQVVSL